MHVFKGERDHRTSGAPSRKLWHALHAVDAYLRGQSSRSSITPRVTVQGCGLELR
jgi:hypothetical protein